MNFSENLKTLRKDGVFSVFAALIFAAYNCYLGLSKSYGFAISMAVYYTALCSIRLTVFIAEKRTTKSESERIKIIIVTISAIVITLNLFLIAPITLMVLQKRVVTYGIIPAIGVATYTTYKIISAAIYYKKYTEINGFQPVRRTINLIDALASILVLQNTLILVNSDNSQEMRLLTVYTSAAIFALIMFLSIFRLIKQLKISDRKYIK